MPATVKSLRRRSNQKMLHLPIRRRGGIREPQGHLIDRGPKRLDQIVRQSKSIPSAPMEDTERWCKARSENRAHQVPPKNRIAIVQTCISSDQLASRRLSSHSPPKCPRPVETSGLSLDISGITRAHLIREREQLSPSPNLQVLEDRGLPLDLRPHQPCPRVLLARE